MSNLARYTAGQTHFYPAWTSNKYEDVAKLSKEVSDHLSQDIALEAVLESEVPLDSECLHFMETFLTVLLICVHSQLSQEINLTLLKCRLKKQLTNLWFTSKPPFCTPHVLEREELGYELGFANIIQVGRYLCLCRSVGNRKLFHSQGYRKALSSSLPEAREYNCQSRRHIERLQKRISCRKRFWCFTIANFD